MRKELSLLLRLLEGLLGFSIRKISIPQTEKAIETDFRVKGVRLDVYVEDENGRVFDIEMQSSATSPMTERPRTRPLPTLALW